MNCTEVEVMIIFFLYSAWQVDLCSGITMQSSWKRGKPARHNT